MFVTRGSLALAKMGTILRFSLAQAAAAFLADLAKHVVTAIDCVGGDIAAGTALDGRIGRGLCDQIDANMTIGCFVARERAMSVHFACTAAGATTVGSQTLKVLLVRIFDHHSCALPSVVRNSSGHSLAGLTEKAVTEFGKASQRWICGDTVEQLHSPCRWGLCNLSMGEAALALASKHTQLTFISSDTSFSGLAHTITAEEMDAL
ncbi:uncharacterized protein L969DRAFT_131687 [Mixia osmundae IAM 14324]|uniref:uncharacterized protein n=1 Tax=Mixia osmundae (strain CBS 9802 / IAM 14324 / JCM 22182 / KY 12970) TaxID=764103 RepID=UPI0004A54C11|nr:uncharacterized protein L969DRAFT_131687 [Mixia osmundae IAM 14324]KEI42139.1 hypothetical protein L969DRAFT_131687 [Mixia osmundae IAM 14324]